jgi:cytochrome c553
MKMTSFAAALGAALLLAGPMAAQAQGAKPGDAVAGEKKAATCVGCHNIPGYQASFPEVYKVPKIAGQSGSYIVAALTGYKKGERRHPTMRSVAATLSDQDMADLAAFYEQLAKRDEQATMPAKVDPPANVAALLAKANCASCHGANFSAPIASYPKLAGQHADYLYVSLKAYQTDHNTLVGRNNQIMMGMARPYTHPELKAMANYLSQLPSELKTVSQARFR